MSLVSEKVDKGLHTRMSIYLKTCRSMATFRRAEFRSPQDRLIRAHPASTHARERVLARRARISTFEMRAQDRAVESAAVDILQEHITIFETNGISGVTVGDNIVFSVTFGRDRVIRKVEVLVNETSSHAMSAAEFLNVYMTIPGFDVNELRNLSANASGVALQGVTGGEEAVDSVTVVEPLVEIPPKASAAAKTPSIDKRITHSPEKAGE